MSKHMTDEELLTEYLKTKDHDLFADLYERMHQRLYGLALQMLPNDAEDIVQDVFCKLCELEPREFYPPAESFLFRVLWNLAIDRQRHEQGGAGAKMVSLTTLKLEEEPIDERMESASERAEKRELWEQVKDAVDLLPPRQQKAIRLYYWQDLTIAETAEMLGIEEDAAETLIRRGRDRLRKMLTIEDWKPRPLCSRQSKTHCMGDLAHAV